MKKVIAAIFIIALSLPVHASFMELETSFGMMKEFDTPQIVQEGSYPNFIDADAHYTASCKSELCVGGEYNYFGFRFALTDTFIWQDADVAKPFNNALLGSFKLIVSAGGGTYEYLVEDNGDRWIFGQYYNQFKTPNPIYSLGFSIVPVGWEITSGNNAFIFDQERTKFFIGDAPLTVVPEPETFALFLLGAVGLCVRRQIKANATLPV